MKKEIFATALSDGRSIRVHRDPAPDVTHWEITLQQKGRRSQRSFSARNVELISLLAKHRQKDFMGWLSIGGALPDSIGNSLLLVVDKFSQVDVLRYPLGADGLFTDGGPEILPLRSYELVPQDEILLGEHIEDVTLAGRKLIAMSASSYRRYDSHFFTMLDLDRSTTAEFRVSSSEIMDPDKEIRNEQIQELKSLPLDDLQLIRVLNSVKAQGGFADSLLRLRFALLSPAFRESFTRPGKIRSDAFFFVEIGGRPMLMFYTNLNEWYITDESVLHPETPKAEAPREAIERLFSYD